MVGYEVSKRSSALEIRSEPTASDHERGEPQDRRSARENRVDPKGTRAFEAPPSRLLPPSPPIPSPPLQKEPFSQVPPPMLKTGFASSVPDRRRRHYLSHDGEGGSGRRPKGTARRRRENRGSARGKGGGSPSNTSDPEEDEEEEEEEEEIERDGRKPKERPSWWTRCRNFLRGKEEESDTDSEVEWPSSTYPGTLGESKEEDSPQAETIIDLGAAFRAYLNLYSEGMFNLVEAALSVRSDETQNLVTLEELQQACENAVLIRLMVVRNALNLKDPQVQSIVSDVAHRLIQESSGDQLNPTLENFLEAFFPLPFFSLTEKEYLTLKRSGFEFVSLLDRYRHVLPKGKFCFSIRLIYSVWTLYSEMFFLIVGFILNFLIAVCIVIEIACWFARDDEVDVVSRGFYACITLVAGYVLVLMTVTMVLRPPLLVSRSVLRRNRGEPSLYVTVFPLFPLYDFICLFSLRKIRKNELQLLDEHNFFATSRLMMYIFCLFYGLPQAFLATALVNVGSWSEFSPSDSALLPSQFVRTIFIIQFTVMTFRIAFSCWAYSSVHLLGFGWPSISINRFGIKAHDSMAKLLILLSPFLGVTSLFLFLLSFLEATSSSCWGRLYTISGLSALSVIIVVIVCAMVLRLTHRGIACLLSHGAVCGVSLSALIVALWVLILPYSNDSSEASSEKLMLVDYDDTDKACLHRSLGEIFTRFSSGMVVQGTFFFIFILWLLSLLGLCLRYGCGIRLFQQLEVCAEALVGMCCTNANSEDDPLPIEQTEVSK